MPQMARHISTGIALLISKIKGMGYAFDTPSQFFMLLIGIMIQILCLLEVLRLTFLQLQFLVLPYN